MWRPVKEIPDDCRGFRRAVAAECRRHPSRGKEDIAGLLNLLQQLEAGTDVLDGRCGPQRVVQMAERRRAPTARDAGSPTSASAAKNRSRSARSADNAGATNCSRAFRSGFIVRSICCSRMVREPGTSRTASACANAMKSGSASGRPGTASSPRQIRSIHPTVSGVNAHRSQRCEVRAFLDACGRGRQAREHRAFDCRARDRAGPHQT